MNQVDGVYTKEDYHKVESYLGSYYPQIALFWAIGCDTGYRVSDILPLKVCDLTSGHISLVERKTGKQKDAYVSSYTLTLIFNYVAKNGLKMQDHIFWCGRHPKGVKPVSRQYVWRMIKQAGEAVGLPRLSLEHIARARHMRGESLLLPHLLMSHSKPLTTVTNPPRLGMSKEEWNNFLRGLIAV